MSSLERAVDLERYFKTGARLSNLTVPWLLRISLDLLLWMVERLQICLLSDFAMHLKSMTFTWG